MKLRAANVLPNPSYRLTNGNLYEVAIVIKSNSSGTQSIRAIAYNDGKEWTEYDPKFFEPIESNK